MGTRENKGNNLLSFSNDYVIIDIETTGFDPEKDKIIEIGALKVQDGKVIDTFDSLVYTDYVPEYILKLTGINIDDISNAPKQDEVLVKFYEFIQDFILVGHNVNFDINFLYDNFLKILNKPLMNDFIDTLRLSKYFIKGLPSYKLSHLSNELNIKTSEFHRALSDCYTTKELYDILLCEEKLLTQKEVKILEDLKFKVDYRFKDKKFVFKGALKFHSFSFIQEISKINSFSVGEIFFKDSDYLVLNESKYQRYMQRAYNTDMFYDKIFYKAESLEKQGTLTILSESMFYDLFNIPCQIRSSKPKIKDIESETTGFDETHPLFGKTCVFTGTLEKMARADAMQEVVNHGGYVRNGITTKTNYLILANNTYSPLIKDGKSSKLKKAEKLKSEGQDIEILSENVFYDLLEI
ncbi:exonuclease domain-containing protein [Anaerostipes hominis (ex Lee et al. 2021)]|uniref:exonuclease domain-containing protein n=1 Tax=Anaerostipes hominis (ex Lee et al. 2021) TaxID=2025494 RepID=UPI0022E7D2EA|nr:exonuclease domain-containing protein [Anaerostipes hominis (ex Lee et al. 2021)]